MAKAKNQSEEKGVQRVRGIIETGAEIAGGVSGAVLGASIAGPWGLIVGGGSGPIVVKTIIAIGNDIYLRIRSRREDIRIGAAFAFAIDRLNQNIENGGQLREEAFFLPSNLNRSDAEEIFEGIVLSSQREYEERKVKFLGYLFANISTNSSIDLEHANQLIRTCNQLSFRQLCILRLLQLRKEDPSFSLGNEKPEEAKIDRSDVIIELRDLFQKGLISIISRFLEIDDNSIPIKLNDLQITDTGEHFSTMLCLDEIDGHSLAQFSIAMKI